jgi:hypothetical protein
MNNSFAYNAYFWCLKHVFLVACRTEISKSAGLPRKSIRISILLLREREGNKPYFEALDCIFDLVRLRAARSYPEKHAESSLPMLLDFITEASEFCLALPVRGIL